MDMKSAVILEATKGENRQFQFVMPVGAPFGECYDACFEMLNKITELAKQAAESAKPAEEKAADAN